MTPDSIHGRLNRLQWLALVLAALIGAALSLALTWQRLQVWHRDTLEQIAQSVVRHGLEWEDEDDADLPDRGRFTSQIWTQDGVLHYSSTGDDGPPRQPPGWHTVRWQGQNWNLYTLEQEGLTIQIGQPAQSAAQVAAQTAPTLLAVALGLALLLQVLLRRATQRSLQPLKRLQQTLTGPPSADPAALLDQPWPRELQPLVQTLQQQFRALAAARTAHTRLVARAAHEFRTPLAAVRLHAQLLGRTDDPDARRTHQQRLIASVDHMTRLVDQLLLLSELEAPQPPPQAQRFDVESWLAPKREVWHAMAQSRGVRFNVTLPPGAQLHGDPAALLALLDNLVHNALRHSPSGQDVHLELTAEGAGWQWTCIDHGPGLSQAQRAQVGQGFAQTPHGSGLGLTIARRVVEQHGGTLHFDDTPGGGLTVRVWLPARGAAADSIT